MKRWGVDVKRSRRYLACPLLLLAACFDALDGPYDGYTLDPEALPICTNVEGWSEYRRLHADTLCIHCPFEPEPCVTALLESQLATCLGNEWMCDGGSL